MSKSKIKRAKLPALSHIVCVSGSDHKEADICQSHQQVLSCTWLSIRPSPSRLWGLQAMRIHIANQARLSLTIFYFNLLIFNIKKKYI